MNEVAKSPVKINDKNKDIFQSAVFFLIGFFVARTIMGSTLLALPFAGATGYLSYFLARLKASNAINDLAL